MKKIEWNKVTWYSKLLAVIVVIGMFAWAFHLGRLYEEVYENQISVAADNYSGGSVSAMSTASINSAAVTSITETIVNDVAFGCDSGKTIQAEFMQNTVGQGSVALELSDGRSLELPQAMAADGARYATPDGSFVFWDKGSGAFVEEGMPYATTTPATTYSDCTVQSTTSTPQ